MTRALTRFALATVALLLGGCKDEAPTRSHSAEQAQPAKKKKDPAAARAAIVAGAVVVDVRTQEEFEEGHVAQAAHIPVDELGARLAEVEKLVGGDKSKAIVVYCATGRRAATAMSALQAAGYVRVINGGGFDDLR